MKARKRKDTGLTKRKVNRDKVAKALKATSAAKTGKSDSPAELFAVRRHVMVLKGNRRQSL